MKVAFRADASLQMGTGHVMRCLTLADKLAGRGVECLFICREHPGHVLDIIRSKGHRAYLIPLQLQPMQQSVAEKLLAHSCWLGTTQENDAAACAEILKTINPDWLVVDHYALDSLWEEMLVPYYRKLMVIDDLADRTHCCDLILDQNLGRKEFDYRRLVPEYCKVLIGPQYALLRPEFAQLRGYSLKRRQQTPQFKQLLIAMGGVDENNVTGEVLEALRYCSIPVDCRISIVLGATAPWVEQVLKIAAKMPWSTEVFVGVNDMAQRMANADLAIGAAGSTSWERCCLGLPGILFCLAENQSQVIRALEKQGAAVSIVFSELRIHGSALFQEKLDFVVPRLPLFINSAMEVTGGEGGDLVCSTLLNWS